MYNEYGNNYKQALALYNHYVATCPKFVETINVRRCKRTRSKKDCGAMMASFDLTVVSFPFSRAAVQADLQATHEPRVAAHYSRAANTPLQSPAPGTHTHCRTFICSFHQILIYLYDLNYSYKTIFYIHEFI
jgi:hypothetical protein